MKLAAARLAAGLGVARVKDIPVPWSSEALSWGLGGGLHMSALWELPKEDDAWLQEGKWISLVYLLRCVFLYADKPDPGNPGRTCPLITCAYPKEIKHNFSSAHMQHNYI